MLMQPQFHLSALRASIATGSGLTALTRVNDPMLPDNGTSFLAPQGGSIRLGAAGGTNISQARVNTPTVREVGYPEVAPYNNGLTVPSPANLVDFGDVGIRPNETDAVGVDATHSDAGTQVMYALLLWQFGRTQPSSGKEYRIRFTGAITGSAGTWQSGAITLLQNLPGGRYQVVGLDVFGTNLLAARLIFPGGGYRPGILARNAITNVPRPEFTDGRLGVYGEFDAFALPQLEIYVEAANTAQVGYLDLVKK